jgi:hypothetical protein
MFKLRALDIFLATKIMINIMDQSERYSLLYSAHSELAKEEFSLVVEKLDSTRLYLFLHATHSKLTKERFCYVAGKLNFNRIHDWDRYVWCNYPKLPKPQYNLIQWARQGKLSIIVEWQRLIVILQVCYQKTDTTSLEFPMMGCVLRYLVDEVNALSHC